MPDPFQAMSAFTGLLSLGLGRSADRKNQRFREMEFAESKRQFNQQMNESVYRRVLDAKRAGVHPLFALGASSGASPTLSPSSPTGGAASDAASRMAQTMAQVAMNRERAETRKSEAEAALADATTATISQRLASQGRDGAQVTEYAGGGKVTTYPVPETDWTGRIAYGPAEFYNPQVPTSQRPGVASGTNPTRIEVTDPNGHTYTLPSPDLGLDEVGQIEYVLGIPSRMWKNFRNVRSKEREIRELNAQLTALRNVRMNPNKKKEYQALKARVRAKIKALYNKLRRK